MENPMNKRLQELTDVTIKDIRKLEIVLPEIYRDYFYTNAGEMDIVIDQHVAIMFVDLHTFFSARRLIICLVMRHTGIIER